MAKKLWLSLTHHKPQLCSQVSWDKEVSFTCSFGSPSYRHLLFPCLNVPLAWSPPQHCLSLPLLLCRQQPTSLHALLFLPYRFLFFISPAGPWYYRLWLLLLQMLVMWRTEPILRLLSLGVLLARVTMSWYLGTGLVRVSSEKHNQNNMCV